MNLTEEQIIEMLDEYLEAEFTFIRTDELAALLVPLEDRHNRFILAWVKSLASTQVELAHQFRKEKRKCVEKKRSRSASENPWMQLLSA